MNRDSQKSLLELTWAWLLVIEIAPFP